MTDLPAPQGVDLKAILSTPRRVDNSEGMSYLQSLPRRLVTLYLPLSIIVFVLLFPFYWMGLTAIKPDEQLLDLETYSPFWTWNPTFKHIHKLLFESYYPHWLWNTMYVAIVRHRAVDHRQRAGGLRDRSPALQGRESRSAG